MDQCAVSHNTFSKIISNVLFPQRVRLNIVALYRVGRSSGSVNYTYGYITGYSTVINKRKFGTICEFL